MSFDRDFRRELDRMCELEHKQASLFGEVLAELEDPDLRAIFERLRRDELDHAAVLETHL